MKRAEVFAFGLVVLLSACSQSSSDLPGTGDDWLITIESATPTGGADFPFSVELTFRAEGLGPANSGSPPDGKNLSLTAEFSESGVEQTTQTPIYDGIARLTLVFDEPDSAECTVRVGDSLVTFILTVTEAGDVQISN